MIEKATKIEATPKPIDEYRLKFTKFGLTLEICTYNKRFGKCISKNEYSYGGLKEAYKALQNVTIYSIEPTMGKNGELESLEFVTVDCENFSTPDEGIIESMSADLAIIKNDDGNETPPLNDSNEDHTKAINEVLMTDPRVTVTDKMPVFESGDVYLPSEARFPHSVHYKRALMMMMGHNMDEIKAETGASGAMIRRGVSWFKTYGILYEWNDVTGDVIITQKGAELLKKEGLIDGWNGNKVYSKI